MDPAVENGLFAIDLSDSEDDTPKKESLTQEQRTAQTEEDHQELKKSYQPKIQNGEIWKTIPIPLDSSPIKTTGPEILYAVEELYFYRRYAEAVAFIRQASSGEFGTSGLDQDTRKMLAVYEARCVDRAERVAQGDQKSKAVHGSDG